MYTNWFISTCSAFLFVNGNGIDVEKKLYEKFTLCSFFCFQNTGKGTWNIFLKSFLKFVQLSILYDLLTNAIENIFLFTFAFKEHRMFIYWLLLVFFQHVRMILMKIKTEVPFSLWDCSKSLIFNLHRSIRKVPACTSHSIIPIEYISRINIFFDIHLLSC